MKAHIIRVLALITGIAALAMFSGCAATTTAIRYKDLKVETKMSDSIFLDPVAPDQRTIFVQVRNTTDKPSFNLQNQIAMAVGAKGYRLVQDPTKAHYWLQANILSVGETDKSALELAGGSAVLGAAGGAAAGAVIASSGSEWTGAAVGGLAVGAAEAVAGSAVKVHWFAMVTDVEVSEATNEGISQETETNMRQGTSSIVKQRSATSTNRKRFRTRIASTARQVNLTFPEAEPYLQQGLVNSIAGMF